MPDEERQKANWWRVSDGKGNTTRVWGNFYAVAKLIERQSWLKVMPEIEERYNDLER